jgi:uncharacterized protein (TIGR02118 family)
MIKLLGAINRKQGISPAEFQAYWHDVHAPMIAAVPGLLRYVQSHAILEAYDAYPQAYDGIAEAWFEDMAAWHAAIASPQWARAVADAPNFIGGGANLLCNEVPIIDAFPSPRERESMVKYSGFLTRRPELTPEQFQTHWRDVHGPLVVAEYTSMRRYVQSHALLETYGSERPPGYDGVPQAWFDSLQDVPARLRPREGPATTPAGLDSERVFLQPIPAMLSREIVIVDRL